MNDYGQPVGVEVEGWTPRARPRAVDLAGRDVRVVDLQAEQLPALFAELCGDGDPTRWTYLPAGPFADQAGLAAYVATLRERMHVLALLDSTARPVGLGAYLRIEPAAGSIEVGALTFGPALARRRGATEAMYLMARHVFDDLGYRRYEWKCDSLNAPSRAAAARLGFSYEGTFAQAMVTRGRNRDTAWFSIIDSEWPAIRDELRRWLDPANFDDAGRQLTRLDCRAGRPSPNPRR